MSGIEYDEYIHNDSIKFIKYNEYKQFNNVMIELANRGFPVFIPFSDDELEKVSEHKIIYCCMSSLTKQLQPSMKLLIIQLIIALCSIVSILLITDYDSRLSIASTVISIVCIIITIIVALYTTYKGLLIYPMYSTNDETIITGVEDGRELIVHSDIQLRKSETTDGYVYSTLDAPFIPRDFISQSTKVTNKIDFYNDSHSDDETSSSSTEVSINVND